MDNDSSITRIDHKDPRNIAVLEAERRLFARYGLAYKTTLLSCMNPG